MDENAIREKVVEIVAKLAKVGRESVRPESLLAADFCFTSLVFVRLAAVAQQSFGKGSPLPFSRLFIAPDGSMRVDVTVGQFTEFVIRHLSRANAPQNGRLVPAGVA